MNSFSWVDETPLLDSAQAGGLKRIRTLAEQLTDDWSGMMGRSSMQTDFGAIRFQLAFMSYALGLTHVHRMPAAPGAFRATFDRLIQKILSPDCWTYWYFESTGRSSWAANSVGPFPNEWDPVKRDNIMYSAYVQSMALMYHYLFRDGKYAEEGALTFTARDLGSSFYPRSFSYDEKTLNNHLYWLMVERGFLGIACEPNCIYQVCNQPAIFGFRFHDLVYGGNIAEEVTDGYMKAWSEFGIVNEQDGDGYNIFVLERERELANLPTLAGSDFWMGALFHAWNPQFAERQYSKHIKRWSRQGPDDTLWIAPSFRGVYEKQISDPFVTAQDFGWAAVCAAEMGDSGTLTRLLNYADRYLHPTWEDGAYYYRRNDEWFSGDGLFSAMDPHTGNALMALARLNVPGGFTKLYEGPFDDAHFAQPAIERLDSTIDLRRAWFSLEHNALAITFAAAPTPQRGVLQIVNSRTLPDITAIGGAASSVETSWCPENLTLELNVSYHHETTLVLSW
ncbi:hypothetical protein [Mycobacteroides abscessus]|uniref:linalool dehydratase/isomerase domain-containing protein n=1 Tax=Mycobacteroides abscessus TaxID=36809 RepID=UPI001042586B|nr:hypothetical protein [Mycobacteroides abscessus]